jgi:hypothetical protein
VKQEMSAENGVLAKQKSTQSALLELSGNSPVLALAKKGWEQTYLTTDELAARIKYDPRTIRERLKDSVLLEGIHYIRPFGGRKILYIWDRIEVDMGVSTQHSFAIPMANGGVCHG